MGSAPELWTATEPFCVLGALHHLAGLIPESSAYQGRAVKMRIAANNLVELDFLVKNSALFKPVKALERITPFLASGWG